MREDLDRLGVFGGTFNPIHLGHLVVAEEVRERFSLDRILFVPSYIPPHKSVDVAPARDRLAMVRLAIQDNPYFGLSDVEVRRGTKSYTVDTLRDMAERVSAELYFLIGSEAFFHLHTWKEPPELLKYARFIVMKRAGREVTVEELEDYLEEFHRRFPQVEFYYHGKLGDVQIFTVHVDGFDSRIYLTPVVNIGISSTGIRKRVSKGKSIKYRVPREVEKFIGESGLYK